MLAVLFPWVLALLAALLVAVSLRRLRQGWGGAARVAFSVALYALTLIVAVAAASSAWNAAASALYFSRHQPPGRIVAVNGSGMHIHCTGQGSPTVVLETGFGSDALDWRFVQAGLGKTTRVCSYDRAGYGWSKSRPGPRDAGTIARTLHDLLDAAGIKRPLVLVGQSMGGVYVRAYAARYPREIAALVLVDAATPLQEDRLDPELVAMTAQEITLLKWSSLLGVTRLMGQCAGQNPGSSEAMMAEDLCRPAAGAELEREMASFRTSGEEVLRHPRLGNVPLLVFSHDPRTPILPPSFPRAQAIRFESVWNGMQEDLKRLSPDSRRIIVRGSGHNIQIDRPNVLTREITAFVQRLRQGIRQPSQGTTTIE
jgi:pimeloyl-ACP methyl ester carboxylesterase